MIAQETKSEHSATMTAVVYRESPFAKDEIRESSVGNDGHASDPLPPQHTYGAASLQTYADGQVAYNTHASADGFLAYVNQFEQTSFRVKDSAVEWWQYAPNFDDWQNNYGCDSVEVFYHAGHGGTDASTGNYSAPLGSAWGGEIFLNSSLMSLGDQRLRYLYLATCEGCMVFPPNSPNRTWYPCSKGLRMLFGATANIYDNADYGKNYWNHWNSGDTFSQAWQDSLLDADSGQQPSSMAAGASGQEASDRLFNERLFYGGSVSQAWFWWRWVGNAPGAQAEEKSKPAAFRLPRKLRFPSVGPRVADRRTVLAAMKRLGFTAPASLPDGPLEGLRVSDGQQRFAALPDGFLVEFQPATPTRSRLSFEQAAKAADAFAVDGSELQRVAVLPAYHTGGPANSAAVSEAELYEHIVIYRQQVHGLPVLTPGAGELRVHVNGSGDIRRVLDTRLDIVTVRESGSTPSTLPKPDGGETKVNRLETEAEITAALRKAARNLSNGGGQIERNLIPGHIEIGFALRGTDLVPVARATVRIGSGQYHMLEAIEVDLIG